jgi:kynurenine formamidase
MKFIDLTHPLRDGQPSFPGDPLLSIQPQASIEKGDKCNVSQVKMGTHQGTHLDAMYHFVPDGKTVEKMPLDWFYGPAHVLRIPKKAREEVTLADFQRHEKYLQPGARIIYETGWHRQYGAANYFTDFPSMTQEAAVYIASRKIRLLGMDVPTPSYDYYEVHHTLLGHGTEIVVVESLANLDQVPDDFTFCGFPLLFAGRDGSPIRAVAMVD